MADINNVTLTGRATTDPQVRYTQGENPRAHARVNLAVNRRYVKDGAQSADFITISAWGKTAEFIEKYLKKGMKIGVTGQIQSGSYQNKDGQTVYTTEVVASTVDFLEKKGNASTADPVDNADADSAEEFLDQSDLGDLPF